jgi:hypothetical protein
MTRTLSVAVDVNALIRKRWNGMSYIRDYYKVPAKQGGRVKYMGSGRREFGNICGCTGARLRIRLDGMKSSMVFHPTWKITYLLKDEA